jgi:hypothetical protein
MQKLAEMDWYAEIEKQNPSDKIELSFNTEPAIIYGCSDLEFIRRVWLKMHKELFDALEMCLESFPPSIKMERSVKLTERGMNQFKARMIEYNGRIGRADEVRAIAQAFFMNEYRFFSPFYNWTA